MQELRPSDSMIAILQSTQDALECDQFDRSAELSSGDACRIAFVPASVLRVRIGSVARHQPVRVKAVAE